MYKIENFGAECIITIQICKDELTHFFMDTSKEGTGRQF